MNTKFYPILGFFILSFLWVANSSVSQAPTESWFTSYSHESRGSWDAFGGSEIIGAQFFSTQGDYLGQISDFVIDRQDGRLSHLIVSNVPKMGAESVLIPFSAVAKSGKLFVHRASKETYWFYGEAPYWSEGFYRHAMEPMTREGYRFSELIGSDAHTLRGEEAGWINDVVFNFTDGRAVYFVLSEVEGMEGKMVATPFSTLSRVEGKVYYLDTTKESLLEGPAFASEDKADRLFADEVYRHYGLQPYWDID